MPAGLIERTTDKKPRPGGRTERNRQAVADAVLTCLRQGRLDFEIQEISALSGVHRTTISRRWPDRGALMAEAMREHGGHFSVAFTGDWETDIRILIEALFCFFSEPTEMAMNRMLAISDNSTFHEAMLEYWMPVFITLQEPLKRGKAQGLVKADVDENVIMVMLSSVVTLFSTLRLPIIEDLPTKLADQIILLCRSTAETSRSDTARHAELPDMTVE